MTVQRDEGYATVLLVVLTGLTLVLCGAAAQVAAIAAARVKATTAADLAALAAARHTDCTVAPEVARSNGAELITCHVEGVDVVVDVKVPVRLAGRAMFVTAMSRAGPP